MITEEFARWFKETYGVDPVVNPPGQNRIPNNVSMRENLDAWLKSVKEEQERVKKAKRKEQFKRIMRVIAATIVAFILWNLLYALISALVYFLGHIPILSSIALPTGLPWALIMLPGPTAVGIAALLSTWICGTAKPFVVLTILWEVALVIFSCVYGDQILRTVLECFFTSITGVIFWSATHDDV